MHTEKRGRSRQQDILARIDAFFGVSEKNSTISTEVQGGITTFLTMSYIVLVNPQILKPTGMDPSSVATATSVICCLGTILIGVVCNVPLAVGPGMGLNTYFANLVSPVRSRQVVQVATLGASLAYTSFALFNLPFWLLKSFPMPIKAAITVGIGMYQAFIGVREMGLVVAAPLGGSLVEPADVFQWPVIISTLGLLLIGSLAARGIRGSILLGITMVTAVCWSLGSVLGMTSELPTHLFAWPSLSISGANFDFSGASREWQLSLVHLLAFLCIITFDVGGVVHSIAYLVREEDRRRLGLSPICSPEKPERELLEYDEDESIEETAPQVGIGGCSCQATYLIVGVANLVSSIMGCSPVIVFLESSAGVKEGARTGLASVVTGLLFLLALFSGPLFASMPTQATAPVMVFIGSLMMGLAKDIDWGNIDVALPCFLTLALMPFTSDISIGIIFGVIFYYLMRLDKPMKYIATFFQGRSNGPVRGGKSRPLI
eukprot:TRINITY_DN5772_c0_g1_i1.p1 TRINITY_DN5772_c0_g1~~TRINITY_DN5772_c0_g1_i1.p1  ORF type:complete len:489 (+),score=56.19 TRINITY_DN5772_c0_g1_i1:28-1494(+)